MKVSVFVLGIAALVPSAASAAPSSAGRPDGRPEVLAVKAQSANFRAQPSDKSPIVYSADKFYPVEVIERKNGWVKAKDFEGDTAWVAEKSLAKMDTIVIDTPTANIRQKAEAAGQVLFKVAHGEVFKVEDHVNDWLKVKDAHGDGGWIRADKTWGIEGQNAAGKLDKSSKTDDAAARSEENAKSGKPDKNGEKKPSDKKADDKPAALAPESTEFVCKPVAKTEPNVSHADLTKPAEKSAHEKPKAKPEAHVKKNDHALHAKNGHIKKAPRAQKKATAQIRRKKK